jgi:hypothetical protein
MKTAHDPRHDAYIDNAAPFAQPILRHLRALVHRACPEVVETIKWSSLFFEHQGVLCFMAEFKAHCGFGFWHRGMPAIITERPSTKAMGNFGRIVSLADLPPDRTLLRYLKAAVELNEAKVPARARTAGKSKSRPAAKVPAALAAALKLNRAAAESFAAFSPACRREYGEWIAEAKREETQARRVVQAIEWIAEGKSRNWRYESR